MVIPDINVHPNIFRNYAAKKVLILGGGGFIGRWVARKIYDQGADLSIAVLARESAERIFASYGIHGRVIELDLRDFNRLRWLLQKIQPEIVFNLAGYGINRSERDETNSYQINGELVRVLTEALAELRDPEWDGQQLVHVGSALEYGDIGGDMHESSQPNPTTLYGRSKLAGTTALQSCCRSFGLRGLVARLFTVYGHGEHPDRLLPSLLNARRTGQPLLLTEGLQKRDFTYVGDVAKGLLLLGLSDASPGEIVNLATGTLHSVREFILTAANVFALSPDQLLFGELPTRSEEMMHNPVNIQRLTSLISWSPRTSMAEGMAQTLAFEQQLGFDD